MIFVTLTSCLPRTPIPLGVWKSDEPNIVLFIGEDYWFPQYTRRGHSSLGTYMINNEEVNVIVDFGTGSILSITRSTQLSTGGGNNRGPALLGGEFRVVRNELRLTLSATAQERTGYNRVIIFHRLRPGEYEPPNPDDWFAHLREETEEADDDIDEE